MEAMPTLAAFAAAYDKGAAQVVWTRLVADLETPVSAYLKLAADKPMSFLLESVEGGAARGRYSVIGLDGRLLKHSNYSETRSAPHLRRAADGMVAVAGGMLDASLASTAHGRPAPKLSDQPVDIPSED